MFCRLSLCELVEVVDFVFECSLLMMAFQLSVEAKYLFWGMAPAV